MGILSKDRLIFDPADMANSDQIGSYLIGVDGTVIGNVSDAAKVSITNASIVVSGTDIDIRNLVFSDDKVDVSGSEVSLDSATLAALENITVSATDLDIRDLAFATDSVDVSGSSVTVTATDLDIRDLSHTQDSIKIGDGTDFLAVNADGSINVVADLSVTNSFEKEEDSAHVSGDIGAYMLGVIQDVPAASAADGDYGSIKTDALGRAWVNDAPNVAQSGAVLTVGATEVAITSLANRRRLIIQNTSNKDVFLGPTGVTTTTGIRIAKGATYDEILGPNLAMYLIAGTAGNDVRVHQRS